MRVDVYLDIETTGLSPYFSQITVVGILVHGQGKNPWNEKFFQLIGSEISAPAILALLQGATHIYTYNGKQFDLPFIRHKTGVNLSNFITHIDLMHWCWRLGFKGCGGLKGTEKLFGIRREIPDVDGKQAVKLWHAYVNNNDSESLHTLRLYNREDVYNLRELRKKLEFIEKTQEKYKGKD